MTEPAGILAADSRLTRPLSNGERAEWTRPALDAYAQAAFGGKRFSEMVEEEGARGDATAVMTDMIIDTLHMAMRLGLSTNEALTIAGRAIMNFQDEVEEEQLRTSAPE